MAELLPCPFCGHDSPETLPYLRAVICMSEDCDAEMSGITQAQAVVRWNTRARSGEHQSPTDEME